MDRLCIPTSIYNKLVLNEHKPATSYQLSIPFAYDSQGNTECLNFGFDRDGNDRTAFLVGAPGSGKTNLLRALIIGAAINFTPEELQVWVDSRDCYEFWDLHDRISLLNVLNKECISHDRAPFFIDAGLSEIERRMRIFMEVNEHHILGYWRHMTERNYMPLPRILIVVDGMWFRYHLDDGRIHDRFDKLLRMSHLFGINYIFSSQLSPEASLFGSHLSWLFGIRMVMRYNTSESFGDAVSILDIPASLVEESKVALGSLLRGEFYLAHNGGQHDYLKKLTAINTEYTL